MAENNAILILFIYFFRKISDAQSLCFVRSWWTLWTAARPARGGVGPGFRHASTSNTKPTRDGSPARHLSPAPSRHDSSVAPGQGKQNKGVQGSGALLLCTQPCKANTGLENVAILATLKTTSTMTTGFFRVSTLHKMNNFTPNFLDITEFWVRAISYYMKIHVATSVRRIDKG